VLNPPSRDASNFTKLFHAAWLAGACGCRVPRSCLTSSPHEARRFIASCEGGAIFKGASARKTWVTAYDVTLHEERLPLLATAPVLFQERIVGPDVRVHIVGERTFPEAVESNDVDYRTKRDNRYRPCALPAEIRSICTRMVELLDTPFLGIDFKIDRATGDWYFLEANSMPCYQGYDVRCGGAIGRAIAEWFDSSRSSWAATVGSDVISAVRTRPERASAMNSASAAPSDASAASDRTHPSTSR